MTTFNYASLERFGAGFEYSMFLSSSHSALLWHDTVKKWLYWYKLHYKIWNEYKQKRELFDYLSHDYFSRFNPSTQYSDIKGLSNRCRHFWPWKKSSETVNRFNTIVLHQVTVFTNKIMLVSVIISLPGLKASRDEGFGFVLFFVDAVAAPFFSFVLQS